MTSWNPGALAFKGYLASEINVQHRQFNRTGEPYEWIGSSPRTLDSDEKLFSVSRLRQPRAARTGFRKLRGLQRGWNTWIHAVGDVRAPT